jgi:translation initiation factor 1
MHTDCSDAARRRLEERGWPRSLFVQAAGIIGTCMKQVPSRGGLVYSTEGGRMCPQCRRPIGQCACKRPAASTASADGIVRISRETKGRGGKAVTVVRGLPGDEDALAKVARQLKALCGSGGTVKDGVVEVQGDHCDKVMALLASQGLKVKRAGG